MSEERLVLIETKLAHQEHLVEQLNDVVTKQQEIIMQLEKRYVILAERLRSISDVLPTADEQDERPPHY